MILIFIILSSLLSLAGFSIYTAYLKKVFSPRDRKIYLHSLIGMSLILPLLIIITLPDFQFEHAAHSINPFLHDDSWRLNQELATCYNLAVNEKEFCNCQDLEQNNLILYKEDYFFNSIIPVIGVVKWFFVLTACSIFLLLISRIVYLLKIVKKSRIEERDIEGTTYHILHYDGELMAASFRLFRKYIVWKPNLRLLSEKEQQAILMHEIAHLRNKDTWELIGVNILQVLWLLNPVYYKLKKEMSLLNEFLADQFAVDKIGDRLNYASMLIKLKEHQQFGLVTQFGDSSLTLRIKELLDPTPSKIKNIFPLMIGISSLLFVTGFMSATPLHQQEQAFEQYQYIQSQYKETGKTYFCKTCLYEEINACD